jgi:hypothetical protein
VICLIIDVDNYKPCFNRSGRIFDSFTVQQVPRAKSITGSRGFRDRLDV